MKIEQLNFLTSFTFIKQTISDFSSCFLLVHALTKISKNLEKVLDFLFNVRQTSEYFYWLKNFLKVKSWFYCERQFSLT